jgi:echinoid
VNDDDDGLTCVFREIKIFSHFFCPSNFHRITFKPNEGLYDLWISGATYDRDNGKFECRLKERGTGIELHSQFFDVTVLVPPSAPQINPVNPVAVEGQSTELVCSSVGGSPDPVLR